RSRADRHSALDRERPDHVVGAAIPAPLGRRRGRRGNSELRAVYREAVRSTGRQLISLTVFKNSFVHLKLASTSSRSRATGSAAAGIESGAPLSASRTYLANSHAGVFLYASQKDGSW